MSSTVRRTTKRRKATRERGTKPRIVVDNVSHAYRAEFKTALTILKFTDMKSFLVAKMDEAIAEARRRAPAAFE